MSGQRDRRELLKLGGFGVAAAGVAAAGGLLAPARAYAQARPDSLLRAVLDRGRLLVGTGSTNAPWHFEDDKGQLTGMDITMARILAKGLFDDPAKVEFVKQDPAARIPNITTGKVDIVIQFMTISPARAQLVAFSRPYYVEGAALLTAPKGKHKTFKQLTAAGKAAKASVLQNVDADKLVHKALPQAQVMQLDTQANVIQALDSGRADVAVVDLSTVRWLVKRDPSKYVDAGHSYNSMLYGAAMRQGDLDWLQWVNTTFTVSMYGHQNEIYDAALDEFFGVKPPERKPGFPPI
jgi:polar amino acid transport system substrate-binding protein